MTNLLKFFQETIEPQAKHLQKIANMTDKQYAKTLTRKGLKK